MKKLLSVIALLIVLYGIYYYLQESQRKIQAEKVALAWEEIRNEPDTLKLQHFITEFPASDFTSEAINLLDNLKFEHAWAEAKSQNTLQTYLDFKGKYPENKYGQQLEDIIYELKMKQSWEEALASNSIQKLKRFRIDYPDSPHDKKASAKIIDLEVSKIFSGRHSTLPPPQKIPDTGYSTTNTLMIENGTSFTLTVMYSGVQSKKMILKPKENGSLVLANGHYKVAASVNASYVLPFAGEQDLNGGNYSSKFYIMNM